ncbi:hypothetical protein BU14_0099s0013 [Porphyra umbilicalis]|uniref:Uncharacterized protein n=1 Tax=Porphyra umbilicalis TaxID=2786 RepID=A0A1X6PCZ7_PORUM|nr:hypothetical protein BU14_0099s0013 [Porphyra umbilicalis]|eukprot:OSX78748.1 hypothetical protein BU14_0099s0013 [Porphyra umbilicalis]
MPSRGASVAPAVYPAGSGAGVSAAGADDRQTLRRQRGDPPGPLPPAPAGTAATPGSAAAGVLAPPFGASPAAGALGAPPSAGAGTAAAVAPPGLARALAATSGPPASSDAPLGPPAGGVPSPALLASLHQAALVAAHAAAGVPPPPPVGEGLPPLASFALPPHAPPGSGLSSACAGLHSFPDPSYRTSRRAPVEPRDSQLSLLPDYHFASGLRSFLLAAAAARGGAGAHLPRSATGSLPRPAASLGLPSGPSDGASSAGPPPHVGGGSRCPGGGSAAAGGGGRAVGFAGAPVRGAPVVDIPVPGGTNCLESPFSTASVACLGLSRSPPHRGV